MSENLTVPLYEVVESRSRRQWCDGRPVTALWREMIDGRLMATVTVWSRKDTVRYHLARQVPFAALWTAVGVHWALDTAGLVHSSWFTWWFVGFTAVWELLILADAGSDRRARRRSRRSPPAVDSPPPPR